jgi:hypothetical protein
MEGSLDSPALPLIPPPLAEPLPTSYQPGGNVGVCVGVGVGVIEGVMVGPTVGVYVDEGVYV